MGLKIESVTGGKLALGFSFLFSRFTMFVSVLNLLAGALAVFFLFSLAMSERIQDIGIMKAFGCLTASVFSIFATQLSIMIFLGCVIGTAVGLVAYLGISSVITLFSNNINWWLILSVFLGFFFVSHFFGARPIVKAIQMKPADALSPSHLLDTTTEFSGESLSRFGLTFRVAFRSLMRRALPTRNVILCLTVILALATVAVAGCLIANETTANYLERAVGRDVILVAHKDMIEQYVDLLLQFKEIKSLKKIDYFDQQYAISETLILRLANISGITKNERRLLFETTAYEGYGVVFDPFNSGTYYFLGEGRSGKTFVMSIEPSNVISNWFIEGNPLTENREDYALIGNSLAEKMFTRPLNQEIVVSNKNYKISGICIDPFNNGNVTYLPYNSIPSSLKEFGYNLLLLKSSSENRSQVFAQLDSNLSGTNFDFLELNIILDENISFLENIWSLVMMAPFSSLVTAIFCLFTFLTFSIAVQQREFGIMRAIGAKLNLVIKIVVVQVFIILFVSTVSGTSIGLLIVYLFLIPEPVISATTIQFFVSLLVLAIILLILFSLYFSLKIIRRPIPQALHSI